MGVKIGKITLGMCQTNCFFLYQEDSKKVVLIDPADQGKYIHDKLASVGFEVAVIFLTHGHFDHFLGADEIRKLTGAKIYAPEADKVLLDDGYVNLSAQWARPQTLKADEYIRDGEEFSFEGVSFKCIATPGHTIGSMCFYLEDDKILVSGDTLFYESIGRTDFPTGSLAKLQASIREKLMKLPDDVRVYPGHGAATDIAHERECNPYA